MLSIFSYICWTCVCLLWRNAYLGLPSIFWLHCLFFHAELYELFLHLCQFLHWQMFSPILRKASGLLVMLRLDLSSSYMSVFILLKSIHLQLMGFSVCLCMLILGEGNGNPLQYSCLENPHGQRSQVGYNPWSRKIRHNWASEPSTCKISVKNFTK